MFSVAVFFVVGMVAPSLSAAMGVAAAQPTPTQVVDVRTRLRPTAHVCKISASRPRPNRPHRPNPGPTRAALAQQLPSPQRGRIQRLSGGESRAVNEFKWIKGGLVTSVAAAALTLTAGSASAASIVDHTDAEGDPEACFFELGDIPGVNIQFSATCIFVHEPSGNLQVVARAQLPAGYTLQEPFRGTLDCTFNGVESSGTFIATKSGKVVAECKVPGGA